MWDFEAKKSDRLDRVLRGNSLPGSEWLSRQGWEWLLEHGHVDVNGRKTTKSGQEVVAGSRILVRFPADLGLLPAAREAELIWADDKRRLAIFSKSCGISSVPLLPWDHATFANEAAAFLTRQGWMSAEKFAMLADPPKLEGGLLQRLDRDTSGLLCVALDPETKALFRQIISRSGLEKTYLAIVAGELDRLEGEHKIWLSGEGGAKVKASLEPPKAAADPANLSVHVFKKMGSAALVRVVTCQGARHIVRAGLSALGAPLVGDSIYGGIDSAPFHQLHASSLRLVNKADFPAFPAVVDALPPHTFLDSLLRLGLHWSG